MRERLSKAVRFLTDFNFAINFDIANVDGQRHLKAGVEFKGWPPVAFMGPVVLAATYICSSIAR